MKAKRDVLMKLLQHTQPLLFDPKLTAQTAQTEHRHDREMRRYTRTVQNNVARIQRMLNDAESFWQFGDQHMS